MLFEHNISPILLELGPLAIRWYGLLFASGILITYFIAKWAFKKDGLKVDLLDSVAVYLFVGLVIGARLGHVFFYDPVYFLSYPIEILKIWKGGLASHGAAIGMLIGYVVWLKVNKQKFRTIMNALVVGIPVAAAFVRFGNFFNSEIVGHPTNSEYGVIFQRLGEDFPRHPAQLYEGLMSIAVFIVLLIVFKKYHKRLPQMSLLFLYLFLYFGGRIITEIWKDLQGPFENFPLSMGQLLSTIPVGISVVYFIHLILKKHHEKSK